MKTVAWTLLACGSVIIAGCGQKGSLYLPDKNASVVTRPAGANSPAPTAPAPAAAPAQPQQPQDKDKSDDSQSSKPKG